MINEYCGIARLVKTKSGQYQAEILLDGNKKVVDFMFRGTDVDVQNTLARFYPNVSIVRNQQFLCELDHINLFDCRSDDQDWTPAPTNMNAEELVRF